jgi:hypothetical protein
MTVALDTSELTSKERLSLVLLQDIWFKSPVLDGPTIYSHEDTVNGLEKDLVSYNCSIGYNSSSSSSAFKFGDFASLFFTNIRVEKGDLALGVKWLRSILFGNMFDGNMHIHTCIHEDILIPCSVRCHSRCVCFNVFKLRVSKLTLTK